MIKIISFIDSYKHFDSGIKEYEKRLWKSVKFMKLKPQKWEPKEIIRKESDILLETLKKEKGYKILLYIDSKEMTTEKFAKFIDEKLVNFSSVAFVVWGAYGVDFEKIKNEIDFCLSLSPMTFPHIMALQILFEQIYRIKKIKEGSSYHH